MMEKSHFLITSDRDLDSTDSSTQFLLTLASERYTIYFDIGVGVGGGGGEPGHKATV